MCTHKRHVFAQTSSWLWLISSIKLEDDSCISSKTFDLVLFDLRCNLEEHSAGFEPEGLHFYWCKVCLSGQNKDLKGQEQGRKSCQNEGLIYGEQRG